MTVAAAAVVLVSPFWGRRATSWGHRAVLLISLVGAAGGLLAFRRDREHRHRVGVPVLFALILLTRSVIFGVAWGRDARHRTVLCGRCDYWRGREDPGNVDAWCGTRPWLAIARPQAACSRSAACRCHCSSPRR
ncbi:hypothetical protein [Kibdelosporangium philippinense]|uniref:hypothetical protein n=1 Tax=Kibdelosporangium philippinense TaxID=211113 RepID=UPI003607F5C6